MEVLNGAMLALDSTLVPLLSIADTDPVAAYYLGQVFLLAVALLALVGLLVLFLTTGSPLMLGLVLIPGAALVYFYLSSVRATRFFRRRGEEAVGERASMRTETRGGMDFFAHMLLSKSQRAYFFWNRLFCSVWETPLMMALTPWGFAGLHNNRFLVARHLRAQIRRLQVRLIRQSLHGLTASSEDLQQLQEIFDRLWVVTGDTKLKQAKEEWRNGPPVA